MFHLKNDRPRLIIEHETNFALPGNIKRPCNNNKTGQVELFARQVNYYFKNILVGGACPFIGKAGV